MSKHVDFTKYIVIVQLNEDDEAMEFPIIKATGDETCEYCGVAPAEYVVDASELGDGGYSPGYCYEHAVVASKEAWRADEAWKNIA